MEVLKIGFGGLNKLSQITLRITASGVGAGEVNTVQPVVPTFTLNEGNTMPVIVN